MKIMVIGAGSIGTRHAINALKYAEVALLDTDHKKTNNAEKKISVASFNEAAKAWDWNPDGVIVALPNHLHVEYASHAIVNGVKTILIEKPVSHSLSGIQDMIELASQRKAEVFVVTNMRFHPAVAILKNNLEQIGSPLFARAHYGNYLPNMRPDADYRQLYASNRDQGGGVILDAVHEIDYLSWLFGRGSEVIANAGKLSDLDINVEDFASIIITYENGVRSEIHLDYLRQFKRRGCEIVGTNGTLMWQSEGKQPEHCGVRIFRSKTQEWETLYKDDNFDNAAPYVALMKQFIYAVRGEEHELSTISEGAMVLATALTALESASLKRSLKVATFQ